MVSGRLFTVGLCVAAIAIFTSQPLEVTATLPLVKPNDAKASKLTKSNDIEKPSKINPKLILKGDGKNFVITNTTSKLAAKKLALEKKPLLKTKSIEPKPLKSKIATKPTVESTSSSLAKQRPTLKPKSIPVKKVQTSLQSAQKRLNQNKITASEKLIPESKIAELIERQISPILNMLTKVATTNSKINEISSKDPSTLVRQLAPEDTLERLEGVDRSVRHLKNFMNIISQVDEYLKTKAESALQQLAFIYGGDKLTKPIKASKLHKGKVHRLRHRKH